MGTSATSKYKFVKPDDNEPVTVSQLNGNMDKVETALIEIDTRLTKEVTDAEKTIPIIQIGGIPAGKKPKIWSGTIHVTTGGGGESRTKTPATDGNGIGGIWLGYNGVPKFENISAVHLTQVLAITSGGYLAAWGVIAANTTRIKFQGKRIDGTFAHAYGSITFYLTITGW